MAGTKWENALAEIEKLQTMLNKAWIAAEDQDNKAFAAAVDEIEDEIDLLYNIKMAEPEVDTTSPDGFRSQDDFIQWRQR